MVGFKSLDRHPPPSPSVHGLLLVSHTQRPLLSSYFKPASLSFIFLVSGCDKLLDKELWLEVHDASPSSSASNETLSIRYRQQRLEGQDNTPWLQVSSSSRAELGW